MPVRPTESIARTNSVTMTTILGSLGQVRTTLSIQPGFPVTTVPTDKRFIAAVPMAARKGAEMMEAAPDTFQGLVFTPQGLRGKEQELFELTTVGAELDILRTQVNNRIATVKNELTAQVMDLRDTVRCTLQDPRLRGEPARLDLVQQVSVPFMLQFDEHYGEARTARVEKANQKEEAAATLSEKDAELARERLKNKVLGGGEVSADDVKAAAGTVPSAREARRGRGLKR